MYVSVIWEIARQLANIAEYFQLPQTIIPQLAPLSIQLFQEANYLQGIAVWPSFPTLYCTSYSTDGVHGPLWQRECN